MKGNSSDVSNNQMRSVSQLIIVKWLQGGHGSQTCQMSRSYYKRTVILYLCFVSIVYAFEDEPYLFFNGTRHEIDVSTATDEQIMTHLKRFGVHYSLDSVMSELLIPENRKEESVKILLASYEEVKKKSPPLLLEPQFRHPIISIDGFFTHGRTKIAKSVANSVHGRRILLPTRHVSRLRTYMRPDIKKHYYSLSKYMGANMARGYSRSAPVILERYWHDQAIYVMAKSFSGIVPSNSSVYNFPKDLLVPDIMFFVNGALNTNLHNETTAASHENNILARKLVQISKMMRRPYLIEIGPPSLPDVMTKKILTIINSIKQNFLPRPEERPYWRS